MGHRPMYADKCTRLTNTPSRQHAPRVLNPRYTVRRRACYISHKYPGIHPGKIVADGVRTDYQCIEPPHRSATEPPKTLHIRFASKNF